MRLKTKLSLSLTGLFLLVVINAWHDWRALNIVKTQSTIVDHVHKTAAKVHEGGIRLMRFVVRPEVAHLQYLASLMAQGQEHIRNIYGRIALVQQKELAGNTIATMGEVQVLAFELGMLFKEQQELEHILTQQKALTIDALSNLLSYSITALQRSPDKERLHAYQVLVETRESIRFSHIQGQGEPIKVVEESLAVLRQVENAEEFFFQAEAQKAYEYCRQNMVEYLAMALHYSILSQEMEKNLDSARQEMVEAIAFTVTLNDVAVEEQRKTQRDIDIFSLCTSLLAGFATLSVIILQIRRINKILGSAQKFAHEVAQGNFEARWRVKEKDEIKEIATALNMAFAKVADNAHWYEGILNSIPNIIAVTDTKGMLLFCNTTMQSFLGKSREDFLGQHCSMVHTPLCGTDQCGMVILQKKALESDDKNISVQTICQLGDKVFTVDYSYLTNRAGQRTGHVCFARDTTEEVRLREEILAASQAKTNFLSTITHEIRTPMNAIMGFAHIFERSNLTTVQKTQLEKVQLACRTLLNIINDVLDMSKIEAGKLELEQAPFYMPQLLDTVHSIAGFTSGEKGLDFHVYVDPRIPEYLLGDSMRISQILMNLLSNAIKFTSSGQVALRILLRDEEPHSAAPGEEAVGEAALGNEESQSVVLDISVADTGLGMSESQLALLFQPFTQADSSITRRFGGTGLGLAIVKQLVNLMGGHIEATSAPGVGTTFALSLRLGACTEASKAAMSATQLAAGGGAPDAQEETLLQAMVGTQVLLVEDNEINQEIAKALLEEYKLVVDVANNGQEAIEMVIKKPYGCIFMDMQMPIMDGLEATKLIRTMGREAVNDSLLHTLTHVPIIAMTANALLTDRDRCLEVGMNAHISKPVEPYILRNTLLSFLGKV